VSARTRRAASRSSYRRLPRSKTSELASARLAGLHL
jgi:hypothetical protein